jgi:uncharacterized spore protein YtfJ
MEKKELIVDSPVAVAGLTLIPVAQVLLNYWHVSGGASFFGLKQPVAVILVSASAKRAFRITGEEVSIDQLIQEAPGIKEMLERI